MNKTVTNTTAPRPARRWRMPAGRPLVLWRGWPRRSCATPIYGLRKKPVMHPLPIARERSGPSLMSSWPMSCRCCCVISPTKCGACSPAPAALPPVCPPSWNAFQCGDVDAEQIRVIDRVARRVTEAPTLAAIDDQVIDAARTRTPKQLHIWLLRLAVRWEPHALQQRHRRALAEHRVTVVQGADGMGYVTG
jgi:Domain of unknown function (DUF222)